MDAEEWSRIVDEHTALVWRTVYRLVSHQADAEDVLQETFVSAWKAASQHPVRNWVGFLQHLATVRALDQLRRRRSAMRRASASMELDELTSMDPNPPARAQSGELAEQLRDALARLPALQSQVYCLRHLNGMSYREIAGELGMTESNVGINLHRAGERLRAALTQTLANEKQAR